MTAEPDTATFEALVVTVVALLRIRDASPDGGAATYYYAATALAILRDEYDFGALISQATATIAERRTA